MAQGDRELPEGWVREFDPNAKHYYYVDTRTSPPKSIWVHPYDDEDVRLPSFSNTSRSRTDNGTRVDST